MKKVKCIMIRSQQFEIACVLCVCMVLAAVSCKKDNEPTNDPKSVKDIDGNIYTTVKIGDQFWTVENLRTTKYNDGTPIQPITNNNDWMALTNGSYCYYNNEPANDNPYGKLYNWYAVNTGKLCPRGWHIPTEAEWTQLIDALGGEADAGGKMKTIGNKEAGTGQWNEPNTGATNESGFTGLPGGYRYYSGGTFSSIGNYGHWWSSTEYDEGIAWDVRLQYGGSDISMDGFHKKTGLSCRCIRD